MRLLSKQSIGDFYTKCASTLSDQLCNFRVVVVPHRFHFAIITNWLSATAASCHNTALEFSDFVKMTHCFTNVCKGSLFGSSSYYSCHLHTVHHTDMVKIKY